MINYLNKKLGKGKLQNSVSILNLTKLFAAILYAFSKKSSVVLEQPNFKVLNFDEKECHFLNYLKI